MQEEIREQNGNKSKDWNCHATQIWWTCRLECNLKCFTESKERMVAWCATLDKKISTSKVRQTAGSCIDYLFTLEEMGSVMVWKSEMMKDPFLFWRFGSRALVCKKVTLSSHSLFYHFIHSCQPDGFVCIVIIITSIIQLLHCHLVTDDRMLMRGSRLCAVCWLSISEHFDTSISSMIKQSSTLSTNQSGSDPRAVKSAYYYDYSYHRT